LALDPTATHLPILESLFAKYDIKDVLEFGCGLFSTPFFNERARTTSIEMQHKIWFEKVREALPKADLRLALGPETWRELIPKFKVRYDLIFVDGHGDSRPECMEWAKNRTDLIVAHDTEHPYYGWDRADMSGFTKYEHKDLTPWTTVWVKE
jgi:predicted O-methyltransferase YrrM